MTAHGTMVPVPELDAEAFLARTRFNDDGLVPAVAQQWDTGEVLMLAWMNPQTLAETLATGRAVYFSRSRQERWAKGDTSGNVQIVREARLDCDGDTILLKVDQSGAACHTGTRTCFDDLAIVVEGNA